MIRYCIVAFLVCQCFSSRAETPIHAYSNLDIVSNGSKFDLAEVLQYQEPADRYADRSVSNDSYMITYRREGYHVTLFEKVDGFWEFKTQLGLHELLDLDMDVVSRLDIEIVNLNADASVDIAYSVQNFESNDTRYDTIRAYLGPDGYDRYNSFGIGCCQSIQNLIIDEGLMLIRSNRELHVFRLGAESERLGIYSLNEHIRDIGNVAIAPEVNRLFISGRAIRETQRQSIFVEYQYDPSAQEFGFELKNSIVKADDDTYSDRALIITAQDDNNFLIYKVNERVAIEYKYSIEEDEYVSGRSLDFDAFVSAPYYGLSTSVVYRNNQVFGVGYRGLFQIDLDEPTVVNQLLTLEDIEYFDIGFNVPKLANVTESELIFAYENTLTQTFSREDNSKSPLIGGIELFDFDEASELSEELMLGIDHKEVMAINFDSEVPEVVFSRTFQELAGAGFAIRLIGNTLLLASSGQIHEVEFLSDGENVISYTVSSFPILDTNGEVYEEILYRAYIDTNAETIVSLAGNGNGLNVVQRDGDTFRLTHEITRDLDIFASVRSFERVIFENKTMYLIDPYDHIFYIFDFSDEQPRLVAQLYDETFFDFGSYMYVRGLNIHVYSREFHTTMILNDEGEVEVQANTPIMGRWKDVGDSHGVTMFDQRYLRLREKNPITGIYESLSELDVDMRLIDLQITDSYAIAWGKEHYVNFNQTPTRFKIFSLQRAPIALENEYSIVGNQGEQITVDLAPLFLELDKYDNLVFESDLELNSLGWNIAGNMLEKVDLESFGDFSFTLTATDNSGKTASIDFSISLNRRPQLTQDLPEISLESGETQTLDLNEYFVDDPDQTITFSLRGDVPQGVTLDDNNVLTIAIEASGEYVIGINVVDSLGAINEVELLANIEEKPTPTPVPTPAPTPAPPNNSGSSGGSASPLFYLLLLCLGLYRTNRRRLKF